MKKNKTMRLIAITLLFAMIALVLVSGTYAKYTSSASGEDTARVAKWDIEVNDAKISTKTFTIDLFNTINDTDLKTKETDVTGEKVIAPGTSGSFAIKLENLSEVTAKYGINYTITNTAKIPVEFSIDNGQTWTTSLANVAASDKETLAAKSGSKTINVQWKWAYEKGKYDGGTADDAYDTKLGLTGTDTLKVKIDVTATQVD